MHNGLENLSLIKIKVNEIINKKQLKTKPNIIIVTKTFPLPKIMPFIIDGHMHYGENKIQEAENKWSEIKSKYKDIKLHMVGKLQSNKAKKAVKLFDYIHSLDNAKLASKISQFEKELNKKVKLFIQVNIDNERQKSGIILNELSNFYNYCKNDLSLNIIGLMCLPPINVNPNKSFEILNNLATKLSIKDLSIGMSADFEDAIVNGSTYLRLGSVIMGKRDLTNN
jgi:PLP dependent protein